MALKDDVAERYPALLPLLKNPEIGRLFTQAVQQNWSPNMFQSRFMATRWFRSQSAAQRQWWVLAATDPGEAKLQRQNYSFALQAQAMQTWGQRLAPAVLRYITDYGLARGYEPNSPEMLNYIRLKTKPGGGRGTVGALASQIRQIGTGQWYVRPSAASTYKAAQQIILGQDSMESVNARFQAEALHRYPHLAQRIQGGETLADITAGHRGLVAEELELSDPERVDVVQGEWRNLLGVRDPKTNEMRMMTDSEVIAQARNRAAWWQTSQGRQTDASTTAGMLRMFGIRK